MFKKIRIFGSLIVLFSLFGGLFSSQVSAHTVTDQGSETRGFVHNTHTVEGRTAKFFYVYGTDQFWKDRMNTGRIYFNQETNGNLTAANYLATDTNNFVESKNVVDARWVARVVAATSGQHKMNWHLQFNSWYKNDYEAAQWSRIAQHEIGHVFGLKDLVNSINRDRLMWESAGHYAGLTQNEKYGLVHIWGY